MRLRPVTVSRRKRLDLHAVLVRSALERHDREFADRDPNGNAVQRFNARLHAMGPDVERMPDVPDPIETGSEQGIKIFRPITVADGLHPEARAFFADDELSDVVNEARAVPVLNRLDYKHFDYVENSEHAALVGFQTEAQEKADRAHQQKREAQAAKRKRRAERHKVAVDLAEPVDQDEAKKARAEAEKWAGRRREHNAEVSDRLKYGAYYPGGKVADHQYGPTWEFLGEGVLRSHLDPSLARVAALYPTAESGNLRAGHDKTALLTTTCKLFALDAPYVELNRKMAGCLVVELDSVLRIEEFRASLLEILGPYRMPNLIVGRISKSGFMVRPHLIWILKTPVWYEPYKEWTDADTGEVRSSGREDCKTKPIAKFHAVQRGLTQLLLPLGADPACWNVWKPKNPLSLFWTTVVANGDCWHDLGDFDQIKGWPEKVDEAAMAETAAKMRAEAAGATATASNLAWNLCSHVISAASAPPAMSIVQYVTGIFGRRPPIFRMSCSPPQA